MSKSRAYTVTLNNPTALDYETYFVSTQIWKEAYHVFGKETGEQGTPHLQGYVYFTNPISFNSMKKKIPGAHIEPALASAEKNTTYCTKPETKSSPGDYVIFGECPKQGNRTDIQVVKQVIDSGGGIKDVIPLATSYQSIKTAEVLLKYLEKPRTWKPEVYWFYGPTASGKTREAFSQSGDDPYVTMNNKWFDGYDAHEDVIIDDIRSDSYRYDFLLKLLDRYPMKVETKGGSRQFLAKRIWITCPVCPTELFPDRYSCENNSQLVRRLDQILEFPILPQSPKNNIVIC